MRTELIASFNWTARALRVYDADAVAREEVNLN
jgi:hypothetical protein